MKKEEVSVRKGIWDNPVPVITAGKPAGPEPSRANGGRIEQPAEQHSGNPPCGC